MLNVPELEKKWIKFKLKSFIPHFIFLLFCVLVLITLFFYPYNEAVKSSKHEIEKQMIAEQNSTAEANKVVPNSINAVQSLQKDKNLSTETTNDDKLVLKPSLNFVNEIENSMITYYDDKSNNKVDEKKVEKKTPEPTQKPADVQTKIEKAEEKTTKAVETNKIKIQKHEVDDNMQDVIQRFKKTNNPVLSLFLAKKYYEMKKYNLSYNYALITNQIDNKIDMSWIIFAKSLVKLGQKDMAINTLKSYIKNSNSQTATTLLDEIESGHFQ